jgi:hypothetical protein
LSTKLDVQIPFGVNLRVRLGFAFVAAVFRRAYFVGILPLFTNSQHVRIVCGTQHLKHPSNPQEDSMTRILGAFLLSAFLACAGQAAANTLPDSCGDDKVKFDVTTQEGQPLPPAPPAGKAQIIFIQTENQMVTPFSDATIRFGMDGSWVAPTTATPTSR